MYGVVDSFLESESSMAWALCGFGTYGSDQ